MDREVIAQRKLGYIPLIAGILILLMSGNVLLSFIFPIPSLNAITPAWAGMKPNTAVGLFLCGMLLCLYSRRSSPLVYGISLMGAILVLLLGLGVLYEYKYEINLGIDELFFSVNSSLPFANRMSPITAFNFMLVGLIFLLLDFKKLIYVTEFFLYVVLVTSFLVFLGHLYGADMLNTWIPFPMSIYTSINFLILSLALLCSKPERTLGRIFIGNLPGHRAARSLLPMVIIIPILLGSLRLMGQDAGLYNTQFGTAIFTVANILIFIAIICLNAWWLNRGENKNQQLTANLQNSTDYIKTVFENIGEGIIIINKHSIIESINSKALQIFGYQYDELINQPITLLMPPSYREAHKAGMKHYLQTSEARLVDKGAVELEGLRKNQEIFPLELALTKSFVNEHQIFTGIIRDITERKKVEQYRLQLASIVESSSDAIFSENLNGIITSWNPAAEALYGFTPQEIVNKSVNLITPIERQDENIRVLASISKGESVRPFDTVRQNKKGEHISVSMAISPIKNDKGVVIGTAVISADITERKKIEKMKNEFISIVSHELRTPLTSIQGSLALLLAGSSSDLSERSEKLLGIAKQNSERLIRLINDILDIEKIESGKMEFNFHPVRLDSILQEAIVANQVYAEKFNIKVKFDNFSSAVVNVDKDRLLQVLANLLSNAIKFSTPGDEVVVSTSEHNNMVRVQVFNKGESIPKEFQARVFQRFAQADSSSTRGHGGSGLGLSISKEIMERLGGKINFRSDEQGTLFYFDLPIFKKSTEEIVTFKKIPTILICENDQDSAIHFKNLLEQQNCKILLASSTLAARKIISENHIDALLLDLILPGEDGISFIKELRENNVTQHIPIVIISVKSEEGKPEVIGNAFTVLDWIEKPVDPSRLLNAIQLIKKYIDMHTPTILHVEDDDDLLHIVANLIQGEANIVGATDLKTAKVELAKNKYDLVILDLMLPDGSSVEILPAISKRHIPIVVFSAYELPNDYIQYVVKTMVKSKTSNHEFIETIKASLVGKSFPPKGNN